MDIFDMRTGKTESGYILDIHHGARLQNGKYGISIRLNTGFDIKIEEGELDKISPPLKGFGWLSFVHIEESSPEE